MGKPIVSSVFGCVVRFYQLIPFKLTGSTIARLSVGCLLMFFCGCDDKVVTVSPAESVAEESLASEGGSASILEQLPSAPDSQILDEGGVFSHAPSELAALGTFLKELKENHGIEIFVAMYGFLDGESVEERANRLREVWADRNSAVVVVYESGSEGLSFVANDEIDAMLTRHDINTILQSSGAAALQEKGADNQIQAAVRTLADSLVSKLASRKRANELTAKKRMLVIGSTLACIILVTLIGMLIARSINKADRQSGEFYYFPNARVGTRFGATFSGGTGAELRFK